MTRLEERIQDRLQKSMILLGKEFASEGEVITDCKFTVQWIAGELSVTGGSAVNESKPGKGSRLDWRRDLPEDNEPAG